MFKMLHGLFDRVFALLGALTLSQAPMFMQDYTQQLSGHVAELQFQVNTLHKAAERTGKTLEQFIQKFEDSPDLDYAIVGVIMQDMIDRFKNLSHAYNSLIQSSVFERPFVFMKYFDSDIAKSTYENYHLGLSFSLEGIVYALIGLYLGVLLYFLTCKFFAFTSQPMFSRKKPVVK